ncbi:hypothetical protein [Paenibacillus sp. CMAA1364]
MLKRKITCSFFILFLMLAVGWKVNDLINEKPLRTFVLPTTHDQYHIRSVNFNEPVHINMPFGSREYVRIIHRIDK